jgi:hypothetical protein
VSLLFVGIVPSPNTGVGRVEVDRRRLNCVRGRVCATGRQRDSNKKRKELAEGCTTGPMISTPRKRTTTKTARNGKAYRLPFHSGRVDLQVLFLSSSSVLRCCFAALHNSLLMPPRVLTSTLPPYTLTHIPTTPSHPTTGGKHDAPTGLGATKRSSQPLPTALTRGPAKGPNQRNRRHLDTRPHSLSGRRCVGQADGFSKN